MNTSEGTADVVLASSKPKEIEMKERIEQLIKELTNGIDDEMLEMYDSGELEYWDSGNFDDCFESGMSLGSDQEALRIAAILQEILSKS